MGLFKKNLPAERREPTLPIVKEASPPPAVLPQYRVESVSCGTGLVPANSKLPDWYQAPYGYGQMRPAVDITPKVVEIAILEGVCSHFKRPWRMVYSKRELGGKYRLDDNHDVESYLRLALHNGWKITDGRGAIGMVDEFDWSNFQCQHCSHGRIAGAIHNWFFCVECQTLNCAASVSYPRGAAATCVCGACHEDGVLGDVAKSLPVMRALGRR